MIYSDFENNWLRLQLLSSSAYSFYKLTKGTQYRIEPIIHDGHIVFSVDHYQNMEKERVMISMLLAWSEITIESLVNNIIAEIVNEKDKAIEYIERPKNQVQITSLFRKPKSELSCKLIILYGQETDEHIYKISDKIAFIRNQIIHDKPFDVLTTDEDYIISVLSSREQYDICTKYDELLPVLEEYDVVLSYLMDKNYNDLSLTNEKDEYSFQKLIIIEDA